jgi:hypothetical protein
MTDQRHGEAHERIEQAMCESMMTLARDGRHADADMLRQAIELFRSLQSATQLKPNDAAFRIERTMHIYNETLCAVKHEDLDRLEMALDTALRQAAELRAQPANARAVAEKVEDLVRGLVDQQAMPDKWWQEPLAEILSALLDATLPEAPQPATQRSEPVAWEWEERYREMREAYLMFKRDVGPTLASFASLGGPDDGVAAAYHDLPDDVVIYSNSGQSITAGDVRAARKLVSRYVQPVCTTKRRTNGK